MDDLINEFENCELVWKDDDPAADPLKCPVGGKTFDEWKTAYEGEMSKLRTKYGSLTSELMNNRDQLKTTENISLGDKEEEANKFEKMMKNKLGVSESVFNTAIGWASLFTGLLLGSIYMVSKKTD